MNNRPKDPKTARNKNVLVIGGSGSGKTRFFVKPNLMQCVSKDYPTSFVITDPKGSLIGEVGQLLIRSSYRVKVLNTINFSKSMKYNPFRYLHSEKDVLKLVNTLICNTKGEGEKSAEDFWVKSERLFYTALIGYIWQEAPEEEMNFTTLLEMINASEAREDDPEFQSPVDLMFERLEERDPDHFAVRQYKKFLLSAGKTRSSILISAGARMAPFDIREVRELMEDDELELDTIGDEKTALFLIMSDTDTTFNFILAMVQSQLINLLCDRADDKYGGRLPVHVRMILDEFANIGQIPNFDKLIATIRSREISASIILQSQSQLKAIYKDAAEIISDNADYRTWIRKTTMKKGKVVSTAKDPETESVYEMYYEFEESVEKLAGHRILALNRGEKEKILTVKVEAPEEDILRYLEKKTIVNDNPYTTSVLKEVVEDSYKRLIEPAIEREIRNELTEKAEDGAIDVFGKNLHQLLMQPPIAGKVVLGWDPAFRTGCKLAVVDPTGKVIGTTVIYPTAPTTPQKIKASKDLLKKIIPKYHISLISLGNGTASRESEQFIVELLKEIPEQVRYVIVNEAGASVYSASKLASEEFPKFDVGQRSAASIARRLQDPLAELVKIDPKSIGVGQYQHDMNQKKLGEKLGGVVEDCVNKVGVDLNTASAPLLSYISGISSAISKNIVAYREEHGKFTSRRELLKVPKLGPKAFEQCAGFMRIRDGENPLDGTGVHPESYEAAKGLLQKQGYSPEDVAAHNLAGLSLTIKDYKATAEELGIGEITLRDIVKELEKPARDPRDEMPKPILRTDVLEMKDLKEGMILKGTVRNVIDFGVFVDIGVHQDGLVHISQITDRYIKHPLEAVSVGDVVDVKVMSVDMKKKRIQLTMRGIS